MCSVARAPDVSSPSLRRPTTGEWLFLILGFLYLWPWAIPGKVFHILGFDEVIGLRTIPILLLALYGMRRVAVFERYQATHLLGIDLGPVPGHPARRDAPGDPLFRRIWSWVSSVSKDEYSWRVLVWVFVRMTLSGPLGAVLVVLSIAVPTMAVFAPVATARGWHISGRDRVPVGLRPWDDPGLAWLAYAAPVLALLLMPALLWAAAALTAGHRRVAVWALGPNIADLGAPRPNAPSSPRSRSASTRSCTTASDT